MSQAGLLAAIGAVIVVAFTAETDRDLYVVSSQGTATFTNHSSTTVWLGGCAQFDQEQLGPLGWIPEWGPDYVCFWEGTAQSVEPDEQVVGTFTARRPGVWRLAYPVGLQCDETQPLGERSCAEIRRIHSNEFLVVEQLNTCVVTGCSGHVCFPHHVATTCEWLPHYACFRDAHCGAFGPEGSCAWAPTLELRTCLAEHGVPQRCGDGFLDPGEECDDNNTADCDGCSSTCMLEDACACLGGDSDGDTLCDDEDPCKLFPNTLPLVISGHSGIPDECLCGDFDGDGWHSATDAAAVNACAAFLRFDCVSERDEVAPPIDGFCSATDAHLINRVAAFIDPAYTLECGLRPEGTCGGRTGVPCF